MICSPDGQQLWVADIGDIWSGQVGGGQLLKRFYGPSEGSRSLTNPMTDLAITQDGQTLITAAPQEVLLRDLQTGSIHNRLKGGLRAQVSPNGKFLVTMTDLGNYDFLVWSLPAGNLRFTLPSTYLPATIPPPFVISPDSRTLIRSARYDDNSLEVWSLETGKLLKAFGGQYRGRISSGALTADGKTVIATQSDPGLEFPDLASNSTSKHFLDYWNPQSGKNIQTLEVDAPIEHLQVSADGKFLIGLGSTLSLRDLNTGDLVDSWPPPRHVDSELVLSPDGSTLATYVDTDKTVELWQWSDPPLPKKN